MTPDRLDDLLERALAEGTIPPDATAQERAELEPLLGRAGELRLNARTVRAEADAAMPAARARFQRHLEAQRPVAAAPATPARPGWLGRAFGGRAMTFASSAAAVLVIGLVALLVLRPFSDPETASALTVDDYVQVQGVVSEAGTGAVTVQAPELGELDVALSELTAVSDANGVREPASLRPGDPVLVSGVVTARRAIAASNVAVAPNQGAPTPAARRNIPLLQSFREGLQGRLSVVSLSADGERARVLLVLPKNSILVDVDPRVIDRLLATHPAALGSIVRVVRSEEGKSFGLEVVEANGTPAANSDRPQFQNVRGVIVGRVLNVIQVRTDRGVVPVILRPATSIRFGDSGLTPDDVREGEGAVGWEVAISGNLEDANSRRIIATLVVVIGKAERPATQ